MDLHLEKPILLTEEVEHKSLYKWCLREVIDPPPKYEKNYIPFLHDIYFYLTDISFSETLEADRYAQDQGEKLRPQYRPVIRAKLMPAASGSYTNPKVSMLGTDRVIEEFELLIYPVGADEDERCITWGSPSYTYESDFVNKTTLDAINFYLYLSADRFDAMAQRVDLKAIERGVFRVGGVTGLYAQWTPGFGSGEFKVLTKHEKDHQVAIPDGCAIIPPRLGEVIEFNLTLASKSNLTVTPDEADEAPADEVAVPQTVAEFMPMRSDGESVKLLKSLRLVAIGIVALLVILVLR